MSATRHASNTRLEIKIRCIPSPGRPLPEMCNPLCMPRNFRFFIPCALAFLSAPAPAAEHPGMPEVLAASKAADWRALDPNNTLYVELPGGRVVIEVAPRFAPLHVTNLKTRAGAATWTETRRSS